MAKQGNNETAPGSQSFCDIFNDSSFFNDSKYFNNLSTKNPDISANTSVLNISALCCNEELFGFDKTTGSSWIYPTNYPIRDYQFNIIQAALVKNTLVSLPTGLGKTFIAAVVMYNFYRWYPMGKIIFAAPTRPLVAQQIEACYNIVAIPTSDTIEMTGTMPVSTRVNHWRDKRVFFATPHVVINDLKSGICPAKQIKCFVFDEAHKAKGSYSYCQIISKLSEMGCNLYRVLALSATPGGKVEDVAMVIKNLKISHLELRSELCIDVARYSFTRKINPVIVKLSEDLNHIRQKYVEILDDYARRLKQLNILNGNIGNLSRGRILVLYKEYQMKHPSQRNAQHGIIMRDFSVLITLFHGLELLVKHGSRVFLNFFDEHPEKGWLHKDDRLTALLEGLRQDLGFNPIELDTSVMPDGTVAQVPPIVNFGHPKFEQLQSIIVTHFQNAKKEGRDTKAIVFCEYRESVNLVNCLLLQCRPLIKPQMFLGQGSGARATNRAVISQKHQLKVMSNFREGICNTLVATSVAEEGLDIGNVDIIICFDISTKSPIRLVQRCGRTGRERSGQVFILVTEGREHQTLKDCMQQRDTINKSLMQSVEIKESLYKHSPRMLPEGAMPNCEMMYLTVPRNENGANKQKGQDIRSMLTKKPKETIIKPSKDDDLLSKKEYEEMTVVGLPENCDYFERQNDFWPMEKAAFNKNVKSEEISLNKKLSQWLEWQRKLHDPIDVKHSNNTKILVDLLQYADAKRFELPASTQFPSYSTQLPQTQALIIQTNDKFKHPVQQKRKNKQNIKSPKKDGDIRALFSTGTKSTKQYTKVINELGILDDGALPTSLIDLLVDLSIEQSNASRKLCILCKEVENQTESTTESCIDVFSNLKMPDLCFIDQLSSGSLMNFAGLEIKQNIIDKAPFDNSDLDSNNKNGLDSELDENEKLLLNEYIIEENVFPAETSCYNDDIKHQRSKNEQHFDIGNIDDIFNEIGSDEEYEHDKEEALQFFGLDSIDDIFADTSKVDTSCLIVGKQDSNDEIFSSRENSPTIEWNDKDCDNSNEITKRAIQELLNRSPSPLLFTSQNNGAIITSPILGTQKKKMNLSTRNSMKSSTPLIKSGIKIAQVKPMRLINEIEMTAKTEDVNKIHSKTCNNSFDSKDPHNSKQGINNDSNKEKSLFSITEIVDMLNKTKKNVSNVNKTNCSPILTQTKRRYEKGSIMNRSLTVLESSDSDHIEEPDSNIEKPSKFMINNYMTKSEINVLNTKRKSDEAEYSPFFSKKPKLDLCTVGKKSHIKSIFGSSQKENNLNKINFEDDDYLDDFDFNNTFSTETPVTVKSKLDSFRREKRSVFSQRAYNSITGNESSDDDFECKKPLRLNRSIPTNSNNCKEKKMMKSQKPKQCGFIEDEAVLSGSDVGSEEWCTQDSIGSIIDFICDENHEPTQSVVDMEAHYLESVKNAPRGHFKIPSLPRVNLEEVFSQPVPDDEEQDYEMDSFCVGANAGLTQHHEMSALEIAENILRQKKKAKKKKKKHLETTPKILNSTNGSPIVLKKRIIRIISSDSDNSS